MKRDINFVKCLGKDYFPFFFIEEMDLMKKLRSILSKYYSASFVQSNIWKIWKISWKEQKFTKRSFILNIYKIRFQGIQYHNGAILINK